MLWVHIKTILSFRAYHQLAATPLRYRIGFVIYLLLASFLAVYFFSGSLIRRNLPVFLKNFPQITIEKGVLTEPKTPVFAPIPNSSFRLAFDASRTQPPSVNEMVQNNTLMLVSANTLYIPGAAGMQTRELPPEVSVTTSQDFLRENQPDIAAVLRLMAFTASLLLIPLILAFDFCLATLVGCFFNSLRARRVSYTRVMTWALFLLGPLAVLWWVKLWVHIPLFMFAQVILCIIYMQQIFNTLPEGN